MDLAKIESESSLFSPLRLYTATRMGLEKGLYFGHSLIRSFKKCSIDDSDGRMMEYAKKTYSIMKVYDNSLHKYELYIKENKTMKKNYTVEVSTMDEAFVLRDRIAEKFGIAYSDMKAVVTSYGVRVIVRTMEQIEGCFGLACA